MADRAAPPVAKRTPASQDTVRAALGFIFLAITFAYLARVAREWLAR